MTSPTGMAMRDVFAQFPQSVVLLAAEIDDEPHGLVVSAFMVGVSLDPPMVAVAVQHTSTTWPYLQRAPSIGISLLGADEHNAERVKQLASPARDQRFSSVDYSVHDTGALTLNDSPARLATRIYGQHPAGDHDLILLEVLEADIAPERDATVYYQRSFPRLHSTQG